MTKQMIAYCGLTCTECPAYIATQADDMEALARVATQWSKEFNTTITTKDCLCDGCLSSNGRLSGYCSQCAVRACAIERRVINCAYCDDYGCETLSSFLQFAPQAKAKLEEIRLTL